MRKTKTAKKRTMSYRTKWLITIITVFIALSLIIVCVSQGMFSFKPGSVKANDKEDTAATQKVDDSDKDEPKESQYTVFVSAGNGGSANPNGKVTVDAWGSTTVSFTADEGYLIQSVVVDGEEMGALTSYTLSYITSDHTIMVTFEKIPEPTPTPEPNPTPTPDVPTGETDG